MSSFLNSWNLNVSSQIIEGNKLKTTTVAKDWQVVSVSVTTKLVGIVVTGIVLAMKLVTVVQEKHSSEVGLVMAMVHVQRLAVTKRQRSEMDRVITITPAGSIKVPLVIMLAIMVRGPANIILEPSVVILARVFMPAEIIEVPSMMDVVITRTPA